MRLSTKGRYAVTAMMDLALHDNNGPVTLGDISQSQGISLSYLEQLFARLRRNGLVEGVRGPGGGYRLGRSPSEITVAEIISSVDKRMDALHWSGEDNGQEGERGLTQELWTELSKEIYEFLNGITLAKFLQRPSVRAVVNRQDALHNRTEIHHDHKRSAA
jgi:Rrf2 family protein